MITLYINNQEVQVPEGSTILDAAKACNVNIPTLCHLENTPPKGLCRVCVVEVEGARAMAAACATPAAEGMKVKTNTRKIRDTRRTVVELLLSEHDGDCKVCDRNDDCELQELARELGITSIGFEGEKAPSKIDKSTPALIRDDGKCIKCRRCVVACNETQGVGAVFPQGRGFTSTISPAFDCNLDEITCVQCGQCAAVCPVGAITEHNYIENVWNAIDDPSKYVIVQTAPAIRAALGECFGYEPGTVVTGKMVAALKSLGFDGVFDTNFAADLTIMEEGTELLTRLKNALVDKKDVALPQFTSCCPGWIKFAEHFYPDMLDNLSTCKSPQQMFGALAKTYYAQKIGKKPSEVVVVSIMPCTAKKYECYRDEMYDSGAKDVDYVLTTRELSTMVKQAGIDFKLLKEQKMDTPFPESSGAADIFANTGGVMEAAIRTAYEIVTGHEVPAQQLHIKPIMGLGGIKEASLKIEGTLPEWSFLEGVELNVMVIHSLGNVRKVLEEMDISKYHFIEVMTCPGGCISGGGQPRFTDDSVRQKRIAAIYAEDEGKELRKSHENPFIKQIYDEFFEAPLSEKSHHLLHTQYTKRNSVS
ncbi:NADP-reducing hydrogenase subunit HndC [Limihaloglobus sulfuriphilus]|uniref:NADP-reducing hydrogenase subunit HndC n=1 Tax=Limihaloglobus sulfuriphilus TaxID=1851148 RepID=A0A1Q2MF08_9BACT|nr:NADH-dependent [FeFe] hydrogenase, group A6 [Limihaloglobus sulfuriphilus]AQQ71286.1 NADP-reducing hydrogenase subunit HndC [Limihaloglobus sulfuriphilus]